MGLKQATAVARRHGAVVETIEQEAPKVVGSDPDKNLDDPKEQDAILNPDPVTVKLSYGEVKLHQPSVATRRRIYGFVTRVFTDAASLPGGNVGGLLGTRIASLLCSRDDLEADLIRLCAKLLDKPGKISDERAETLSDEISAQATSDDIAVLYAQLCILARVNEAAATVANPQTRRRKG